MANDTVTWLSGILYSNCFYLLLQIMLPMNFDSLFDGDCILLMIGCTRMFRLCILTCAYIFGASAL